MKKIIIILIIFICNLQTSYISRANLCNYSPGTNISDSIDSCLKQGNQAKLVSTDKPDLKIRNGLKTQINDWTMNIATFLSIFAVGAIVFGAFQMVISVGEEDKIKKGKDIVKWAILGFLLVVSASAFVRLITDVMYSLA